MHKKHIIIPFDVKSVEKTGEFSGYASVFDVEDFYGHVVVKGAFDQMLEEHAKKGTWPYMFFEHRHDREIGEWSKIEPDETGLKVEGNLWLDGSHPDTDALKTYRSLKKKNGRPSLSIGWRPYPGGMEYNNDTDQVFLKNIHVGEISVVKFPANEEAKVGEVKSIRDFEKLLRDAGFSRKEATRIASHGFQRDAEQDYPEILAEIKSLTQSIRG